MKPVRKAKRYAVARLSLFKLRTVSNKMLSKTEKTSLNIDSIP